MTERKPGESYSDFIEREWDSFDTVDHTPLEQFARLAKETVKELDARLHHDERRAFCRKAAIALYASPLPFDSEGHLTQGISEEDCWKLARALWDAKPEDL